MDVLIGKHRIIHLSYNILNYKQLQTLVGEKLGLEWNDFYLMSNGKRINNDTIILSNIHIVFRTLGGKGGFGSMLRAIGAQIEKTTNREACRDLSGRRLRDINEEQRLKKWVAQQAEREKEVKERKKKKLEKLCEQPKHEFIDQEYDKERSSLPEKVEDAVLKGLEASCSVKRKSEGPKGKVAKKKPKLWVDSELEDLSSSECDSDNENEDTKNLESGTSYSQETLEVNSQSEEADKDLQEIPNSNENLAHQESDQHQQASRL